MNNVNNRSVSFCEFLRQRRNTLRLKQADVAAALHVTEEAVGHWESGQRRMELNKIPRLAVVLRVNAADLCRKALDEWYPAFHDGLFPDRAKPMRCLEQSPQADSCSRPALPPAARSKPA